MRCVFFFVRWSTHCDFLSKTSVLVSETSAVCDNYGLRGGFRNQGPSCSPFRLEVVLRFSLNHSSSFGLAAWKNQWFCSVSMSSQLFSSFLQPQSSCSLSISLGIKFSIWPLHVPECFAQVPKSQTTKDAQELLPLVIQGDECKLIFLFWQTAAIPLIDIRGPII